MAGEHLNPWFWPGLGSALLALLLGARAALHRGLAPLATQEGLKPADLGLTARSVRIPVAGGLSLFAWYLPAASTVNAITKPISTPKAPVSITGSISGAYSTSIGILRSRTAWFPGSSVVSVAPRAALFKQTNWIESLLKRRQLRLDDGFAGCHPGVNTARNRLHVQVAQVMQGDSR